MTDKPNPERVDYGPPVGVVWEAPDPLGGKLSSKTQEGCQKLIDRIYAGDRPGGV